MGRTKWSRWLQSSRPMSTAVSTNFVCVILSRFSTSVIGVGITFIYDDFSKLMQELHL